LSAPVQNGPGAGPAFYRMGIGSFPWVKQSGRGVDHPPNLAPKLKSRSIVLLILWGFMACSRVEFILL
jgi:hypothetical protein